MSTVLLKKILLTFKGFCIIISQIKSWHGFITVKQRKRKKEAAMSNISDAVVEVIKGAIALEINGRSFFEHAAETTRNNLGKKMFNKLAQDEVAHLHTFSQLFSTILGGDDWKKFVAQQEKDKSPLIEELKQRLDSKAKEERAGDMEAIRIGMELERKAIDFFENSARETADAKAKEIFERIADEERTHYDLLQAQSDSLSNTGHWFDIAEYRMDGKY